MMTTMFEYGLLTATLFFLTASSGRVWAAADPSEQDYLQEFPVVLSASRLSQSLSDAPNDSD
jgi:hypothetical protein